MKETMKDKLAYSIAEVSAKTSLSKAFLWLEVKRGNLKARNFGRRVLILSDDLNRYLNGQTERATEAQSNA